MGVPFQVAKRSLFCLPFPGGAAVLYTDMRANWGPSPRVRGSRDGTGGPGLPARSIPACAGEPEQTHRMRSTPTVHPRVCGGAGTMVTFAPANRGPSRVCGGALIVSLIPISLSGPSPRVRGSRIYAGPRSGRFRSIPRVRGSPPVPCPTVDGHGSIPACAGEPGPCVRPWASSWVHPRVCGGAIGYPTDADIVSGPSRVCGGAATR